MKTILDVCLGAIAGALITLAVVHFTILQPLRSKIESARVQLRADARDSRNAAADIYRKHPDLAPAVSKFLTIYADLLERHADELP